MILQFYIRFIELSTIKFDILYYLTMKNKFGERLNELLKAENISQKDFAKAICVSQSIVCDWLKGRVQPTADNILNTADFFKVTTDYILGKDIFY